MENRNYKNEVDKIVKGYGRKYHLPNLTSEKFILGSVFGYIKESGWNEDVFYGTPNGGKPGENPGLDIVISRQFGQATHGSMSQVMTITEKYTWCAKMELLGYLADRLPCHGYERGDYYVDDYGQLEDYINPYQELCQVDLDKVMEETEWILPEELAPSIKKCNYNKEGIQKWLVESPLPDLKKWIKIKTGQVTLFASHHLDNEEQGVSTMMWISSGLILKGTIQSPSLMVLEMIFINLS